MTAQLSDTFQFRGDAWKIGAMSEKATFFNPGDWGLHPMMTASCCHKGHLCIYNIVNNFLMLNNLGVYIGKHIKKRRQWE